MKNELQAAMKWLRLRTQTFLLMLKT